MKAKRIISMLLLVCIVSLHPYAYSTDILTINKLLGQLTKPRLTSLQKLDIIESHKGRLVEGAGRVKDIIKSFGTDNEALVYVKKPYKGKEYEIVLTVGRFSASEIKKGKTVSFQGRFSGMTFETLSFDEATIEARKSLWPF